GRLGGPAARLLPVPRGARAEPRPVQARTRLRRGPLRSAHRSLLSLERADGPRLARAPVLRGAGDRRALREPLSADAAPPGSRRDGARPGGDAGPPTDAGRPHARSPP